MGIASLFLLFYAFYSKLFNLLFLLMKLQELTAVAMLTFGVLLAMLGFWVAPTGQVDESVLWLFAQCLIYAGSVMGVTVYVRRWGERLAKGD